MAFVQVSKVSLSFGERDILKDVTLVLADGSKAALTGTNGAGKSTLMKVIAGIQSYDTGEISIEKGTTISYLPQGGINHKDETLFAEAEKAFSHSIKLLNELDVIGTKLQSKNKSSEEKKLLENFYDLQLQIEKTGWHRRESLIKEVLAGLGFTNHDLTRLTDEFSSGWQMRIALAKVLLQNTNFLILDEPTNYLDLEARKWLENYLQNFKGGFLLVSHDRYFLDSCVTETYELFNGKLTRYPGTYSKYEQLREMEVAQVLKAYTEQQNEIQKTEDFIRKFRYNKSKAAMVQDRIRRLEKIELIEIPEQFKKIRFQFPPAPHTGKIVLKLENISKNFGNKKVISNFDFVLQKDARLVLVGKNGAGKSTLLRIMAGFDDNFYGNREFGAGVDIGFFSQDIASKMSGNKSIITLLEDESPLSLVPNLRNMLAAFLFRGDDIYKSISVLSGGEKSRLSLLRLLLKNHNLLILDEPTNHLDMHSQDALLEALKNFGGTVIFVSHDQGFIQNLATDVLELKAPSEDNFLNPSTIKSYPGNYEYYLYTTNTSVDKNASTLKSNATKNDVKVENSKLDKKNSYIEKKELNAKRQKLKREEKKLVNEIEQCESEIEKLQNNFSKPEIYENSEKSKELAQKIETLKIKTKKLIETWENVLDDLSKLE